ncbi:hypothetical protein ACFFH2_15825 [Enterococcus devriesei]|uniref:Uncharacterized protein n=1 Tax=Enterococcus devriesei TaxID=319970 RepID=A0A1L8SU11_9ENTE|nr:hypothetical protein [Enterococcus devriesei]OJG35587.1 hypothetical protein RV00_GL002772 [Enterococcus devriesei]
MEAKDLIDIIIKIVGTTIPGYLAYYCLYKLNIIHPNKNRNEENKIVLSTLALLNCFFGLMILNKNQDKNILGNVLIVFILFFLISIIVLPFVLPFIQSLLNSYLNFIRKKKGIGELDPLPIYKDVFHQEGTVRISVFTFSGKCVVSGKADSVPDDNQFDYFALKFTSNIENPEEWSETEVIALYQDAEKKKIGKFTTYIDLEKSLKFYILVED